MKVVDVRTDDFVRTKISWVLRRARFSVDALLWKVPFSVGIANLMELVERSYLILGCRNLFSH